MELSVTYIDYIDLYGCLDFKRIVGKKIFEFVAKVKNSYYIIRDDLYNFTTTTNEKRINS
jgi:hypothetical protein